MIITSSKGGADWTAIASVCVGAVALLIPFIMNSLQVRRTDQESAKVKKERAHEATSATFKALDVLIDAVEATKTFNVSAYKKAAARAEGYQGVTAVFVNNPVLTDGSIFSCVNAGLAMRLIVEGVPHSLSPNWQNTKDKLNAALVLGIAANERAQEVRTHMSIPMRQLGSYPVLPLRV